MPKLKPDIYSAVIDEAHKSGLRVAAHIYDLDDAKAIRSFYLSLRSQFCLSVLPMPVGN
jgi:imidazolonepropionase-like amidohydrolase